MGYSERFPINLIKHRETSAARPAGTKNNTAESSLVFYRPLQLAIWLLAGTVLSLRGNAKLHCWEKAGQSKDYDTNLEYY